MTADKGIFSLAKGQRSEMPYYFSCIMAVVFTDHSVYFHISNSGEIITQWGLSANEDQFQHTFMGKSCPPQCGQ